MAVRTGEHRPPPTGPQRNDDSPRWGFPRDRDGTVGARTIVVLGSVLLMLASAMFVPVVVWTLADVSSPARSSVPVSHAGGASFATLVTSSTTIGVNYHVTSDSAEQNEPSIAVNPTKPTNIIASGNDYRTGGVTATEYTSFNGGLTWSYNPAATALSTLFPDGQPNPAPAFSGDTNVLFGPDGTAYFAGLAYPQTTRPATGGLFVAHSLDGGNTWTYVKVRQDSSSSNLSIRNGWLDKEWMGINAATGVISIDVINYTAPSIFIDYFYSTDKGVTWNGPTVVNPSSDYSMTAAGLAVDYSGGVDVVWLQNEGFPPYGSAFEFARATAPGQAFSVEKSLGTIKCAPPHTSSSGFPSIGGVYRMNCFPQIYADDSPSSPYKGSLYVTWSTNTTSLQIMLIHSTNNGSTWSSAVSVNNDPSDGADHWFPQLTTGKNGTVYVEFLDRRYNPGNLLIDTTVAVSTDGGASFPLNTRVSSASGNPYVCPSFMGDYQDIYWSPNGTFSIWTNFTGSLGGCDENLYAGQLAWLDLSSNIGGVSMTVDGNSVTPPAKEWWTTGTTHSISVPSTVNTYTFVKWAGASTSTSPVLNGFTVGGSSRLEAIYAPTLSASIGAYLYHWNGAAWVYISQVSCSGGTIYSMPGYGDLVAFGASYSGGSGSVSNYGYSWNFGALGYYIDLGNNGVWTWGSSATGSWDFNMQYWNYVTGPISVSLVVTDSAGHQASASCSLYMAPDPPTLSASIGAYLYYWNGAAWVYEGQTSCNGGAIYSYPGTGYGYMVAFGASYSGGSGSVSNHGYSWNFGALGYYIDLGNNGVWTWGSSVVGSWDVDMAYWNYATGPISVSLVVTDSAGHQASASCSLNMLY